jgi:hypothetical protein
MVSVVTIIHCKEFNGQITGVVSASHLKTTQILCFPLLTRVARSRALSATCQIMTVNVYDGTLIDLLGLVKKKMVKVFLRRGCHSDEPGRFFGFHE